MDRFRAGAVLVALSLFLACLPARAVGRVISSSDGPAKLDELRVAAAFSTNQTTLWTAFRLSGSAKRVAVVLPVAPGSLVDPASEAWFRALEKATAPRVMPPSGMPACYGGSKNLIDDTAVDAPAATLHPLQVAVLDTVVDLDAFAAKNQLALSPGDRAALDIPGQRLLAVLYPLSPGSSVFTQALRVTEPVELSTLPLGIARAAGADPIPFTLWTLLPGRGGMAPGAALDPADVKAVWHAFDGNSDYVDKRHDLLTAAAGASFIREASGNARLFGWTAPPGQITPIPPAADAYYSIAAQLGDTTSDPASCAHSAAEARVAGSIGMPVAPACASGLLARVPLDGGADPTCTEKPQAGTVDADTLRCGAADDFAMAMSGLLANQVGLTRLSGVLGSKSTTDVGIEHLPADPRSPIVAASTYDDGGCHSQATGGSGGSSSWGTNGSGGSTGGGNVVVGGSGGYGNSGNYSSSSGNVAVDMSCTSSGSDSCSGDSSSSSSDSCSGDSSSSSDGATCSGDSSSSSSSDSCSGDSSSSSDGATCSGDSSGSSDGATCSGDSSSSSDGATCSGSSSGSGSSCALAPGGHAHLSAWTIGLVALLLPSRRVWRRRSGRRRPRRRRGHRVVSAGRR